MSILASMGDDIFCHVFRAASVTGVLALMLAFGLGCQSNENSQAGDAMKSEDSNGRLAELSLEPGEERSYSVDTSEPVEIGILCVDQPVGGLVQLKQQGSVSQASTSVWVSRLWTPTDEGLHLQVRNNATNEVRVIVFEGSSPPSVR